MDVHVVHVQSGGLPSTFGEALKRDLDEVLSNPLQKKKKTQPAHVARLCFRKVKSSGGWPSPSCKTFNVTCQQGPDTSALNEVARLSLRTRDLGFVSRNPLFFFAFKAFLKLKRLS